ncbi:hypothetical protein WMY93_018260 [Mugilogobius chulae]|uniref:DNA-directed RNA polymerase n=1 Tax=Mugilogobius chulae TaxID=88201 RepID=A0AAW0NIM5_9GOBI
MDFSAQWTDLPTAPSLKNLTDGKFGTLKEKQHPAIQDLTRAHIESFDQAVTDGLSRVVQSIPPLEFTFRNDRISLAFAEAAIFPPSVAKGSVCKEMRVFPAECRGRRCSYRGRLVEMGGYFVVNGIEKVIRMLIMPRRNYPIAMSRPKWKSRGQGYTQYGISMRCVREEHTAVNMNLHYLENGTVMLNFIYQKELFFLPIGFALKALVNFSDYQIFQELVKGHEESSFYKSCVSEMLRIVSDEGCPTQSKVLDYLGERSG